MRTITIEEATAEILATQNHLKDYVTVTGFDPKKLVHIPNGSCYNYNFYDYDGHILLEISNDDNECDYDLCDNDQRRIGNIGARKLCFDDSDDEICELYNF